MKTSDTSEQSPEAIIVASLVEEAGYARGDPRDYDREHAVDRAKLRQFLAATQPDTCETLGLDGEGPKHARFLRRLQGEIARRGVVDVLRAGIRHGPAQVTLFYDAPTPNNAKAADAAYRNAMQNNDRQTARIEHDAALQRVMLDLLADHTELFKQFSDNPSFKKWLGDTIFGATYQEQGGQAAAESAAESHGR